MMVPFAVLELDFHQNKLIINLNIPVCQVLKALLDKILCIQMKVELLYYLDRL